MNTPTEIPGILGLSIAERKIIQATSNMAVNITDISTSTKIPRTSLLYMLNKLKKRQLIKKISVGKRFLWKSDAQRQFNLPKFGPHYTNIENGIITHVGINAIVKIFDKISLLPKNSRIFGLEPDNSIKYALRKNKISDLLRINEDIKNKSLIVEGIVHEKSVVTVITELGSINSRKLFKSFIGRLEDYVKIPDEFADVKAEVWIFGGSAYIINWDKEIGLEIKDKDMIDIILAMFSCVKELGTRYSQNKKMQSILPNTPQ